MRFFLFRILSVLIIIYKKKSGFSFLPAYPHAAIKLILTSGSGISTCVSAHSSCRQSTQITLVNSCSSFELKPLLCVQMFGTA